jgi:hypothetical protein
VKNDPGSMLSWQTWIDLEARLGNADRVRQLRGYTMQERVDVVLPAAPRPEDYKVRRRGHNN